MVATGWIALHAGLRSADIILPLNPVDFDAVIDKVMERDRAGSRFTNVVVAEGAREVGKGEMYQDAGELRLGGIGDHITRTLAQRTDKECRTVVLGHLQRGGSPNAFDRMLGTNFGACAVRALATGDTGKMVALQAGMLSTSTPEACAIKTCLRRQLVRSPYLGITFASRRKGL